MSRDLTAAVVGALRERERRSKRLHLALAAQTAAAVVVMALTWWSAGPQLVRQVADMLPSPTAGLGQAALGQLTVSWEGLLAAAEHWIESAISMAELLLEVLPVFPQWGSLLAAAGVLWLAVNGFIFRAIAVERRQRGAAGTEAAQ
ncbi:MAG TPA: hypothetical protein VJ123_06250 [Anaerolineales bacterium]|nr:hypothetical protein [Anaerolineales bacterium]